MATVGVKRLSDASVTATVPMTFPIYLNFFSDSGDQLFFRISHNVTHVVKPLLPTYIQHSDNMRDRRHNFVLIEKNSQFNHRQFYY